MAIICNIDDYRKSNTTPPPTGGQTLRELVGPVQAWTSASEKARALQEQAEREEKLRRG